MQNGIISIRVNWGRRTARKMSKRKRYKSTVVENIAMWSTIVVGGGVD